MQEQDFSQYSPKWQFRFDAFARHGAPGSPGYKEYFRSLGFLDRIKLGVNFYAFFFSWIFFLVVGMWRKALALVGLWLLLILVASLLPEAAGRVLGIAWSLLVATSANYAYYLHRIKGSTSWNPFEGIRLF
ncbi:DUF2628 domain-containing protein [Stenotrophomonas sp. MMGLT7]|uniref:DUF2628 domain-containing protein n=1 Tax=Stenotrophomonas sp. MMGLT7 TaxID=2901227 RepID=UPI001E317749|nr:DUF2628 domain-containing protein [Stenotrophomonas sp. MMGLT7]MCD7098473.1 DUF2628 domain-containing protein [Stenotrophomonas sp. MMGLT7]